jgi:putative AdoMet-dependent methyltransferase
MDRRELFDVWASDYRPEGESGFPFEGYGRALETAVAAARVRPDDRVLDLGTGTGALAARFARLGCRVTLADFSTAMLNRARAALPDAEALPLDLLGDWAAVAGRRFDVVASSYVFHEFPQAAKVALLRRAAAHLAPGGRIVIADTAFGSRAELEAAEAAYRAVWDDAEYYWVAAEDTRAARAAGFRATFAPVSFCAGVFSFVPTDKEKAR